jgi:hypothetical protein
MASAAKGLVNAAGAASVGMRCFFSRATS